MVNMPGLVIPQPFQKILVVGPLYDKIEKLSRLDEIASEYDWIIFNSGLCYPFDDIEQVKDRITKMKQFITAHKAAYLVGRSDYLLLTYTQDKDIEKWVNGSYNVALLDFSSRGVIIADGGIPDWITKRTELMNCLEISFLSRVENKPWHETYNGRLGYVITNNPLTNKHPKYYRYSMQLGNSYSPENAVYAVEVDEIGLKKTIVL